MDIRFGGGEPEIMFDMASGQLVMLNHPVLLGEFAEQNGGRLYYQSRSGLSGAAQVPDRFSLRRCGVLRTDVARPAAPMSADTLPGVRIIVPTQHLLRDEGGPIIVAMRDDDEYGRSLRHRVALVSESQLTALLRGELEEIASREVTLTSWGSDCQGEVTNIYERKLVVNVASYWRWPENRSIRFRRMLELVYWNELRFLRGEDTTLESSSPWRDRLGLALGLDGRLYRAAGGILRAPVEPTKTALQGAAPWVQFVGDELAYMTENPRGFYVIHPERGVAEVSIAEAMDIAADEALPQAVYDRLSWGTRPNRSGLQERSAPTWRPSQAAWWSEGAEELSAWEQELMGGE